MQAVKTVTLIKKMRSPFLDLWLSLTNVSKENGDISMGLPSLSISISSLWLEQPDYQQSQGMSRAFLSVYQYWAMSILSTCQQFMAYMWKITQGQTLNVKPRPLKGWELGAHQPETCTNHSPCLQPLLNSQLTVISELPPCRLFPKSD